MSFFFFKTLAKEKMEAIIRDLVVGAIGEVRTTEQVRVLEEIQAAALLAIRSESRRLVIQEWTQEKQQRKRRISQEQFVRAYVNRHEYSYLPIESNDSLARIYALLAHHTLYIPTSGLECVYLSCYYAVRGDIDQMIQVNRRGGKRSTYRETECLYTLVVHYREMRELTLMNKYATKARELGCTKTAISLAGYYYEDQNYSLMHDYLVISLQEGQFYAHYVYGIYYQRMKEITQSLFHHHEGVKHNVLPCINYLDTYYSNHPSRTGFDFGREQQREKSIRAYLGSLQPSPPWLLLQVPASVLTKEEQRWIDTYLQPMLSPTSYLSQYLCRDVQNLILLYLLK